MDQLHLSPSFSLTYTHPYLSFLLLLWSSISSPSLPLLMQHTAAALKTQHFLSLPHLHLGPWPKHVLVTIMPQSRTSGHAFTAPYSLTTQLCPKKTASHSSTVHPVWLRALPTSWAGRTGPHVAQDSNRLLRTAEQNNQKLSYNKPSIK